MDKMAETLVKSSTPPKKSAARAILVALLVLATAMPVASTLGSTSARADSDNAWRVGAGLATGIIIGSAIERNRERRAERRYERNVSRSSYRSHTNWCYNRYRSYEAGSNTYIDNRGRERICRSPYR